MNLSAFADSRNNTTSQKGQNCPSTEHPTHRGPAPPRNTVLTMVLPCRWTPYSLWTFPTKEQLTHLGTSSLWNYLLTTFVNRTNKVSVTAGHFACWDKVFKLIFSRMGQKEVRVILSRRNNRQYCPCYQPLLEEKNNLKTSTCFFLYTILKKTLKCFFN